MNIWEMIVDMCVDIGGFLYSQGQVELDGVTKIRAAFWQQKLQIAIQSRKLIKVEVVPSFQLVSLFRSLQLFLLLTASILDEKGIVIKSSQN